jgi:phosphate:Na+ symporter
VNGGFLSLLGGIALLLWATRLVKTGVQRAFGDRMRGLLRHATANRFSATMLGMVIALGLQSSTATALLLTSFATRGFIALAPALAVMLGADIGSALVVQVLAFDLKALTPLLLVAGVAAFMLSSKPTIRQVGRIIIGLALMIMSLGIIVAASASWRDNPTLVLVLSRMGDEPLLAVLIAAALTWLLHSSVAFILLVISLVVSGIIAPVLGLQMVIGANLGAGLIALGLVWHESDIARRIAAGNLAFRIGGAVLALSLMTWWWPTLAGLGLAPGIMLAGAHLGFNIVLALVFLPLVGAAAEFIEKSLPAADTALNPNRIMHLDENLLDTPQLALGAVSREVVRLGEHVETMLSETILTFSEEDDQRRQMIRKLDDEVDALQEAIKLYLTRLTRQPLGDADSRRAFDLILFTTNLEHVGDIIDKSLLELAAKRRRNSVSFSQEGWSELTQFHARVVKQMKLAMTVFMTNDPEMARALIREKDNLRSAEKAAMESHLARLREGTVASIETSALHLDILRDLKRINAHIVSVAHPILDAAGELRGSRLAS